MKRLFGFNLILAVGVITLLGAGVFIAIRFTSPAQPAPATTSPLSAVQTSGFSNGRIFCSGDENGKRVIFSYAPDGGDKKVIDFPAAYVGWSRDGSTAWVTAADGKLWSMNPDGTNQKLAAGLPGGGAGTPAPSPDGKLVAFTGLGIDTDHQDIWVMNSDGSNARPLTKTTMGSTTRNGQKITWSVHPSWTPDGKKLAYASTQSGSTQIWTMNADGSGATQITAGNAPDSPDSNVPEYSLDGKSIVFWSGYETEYGDIWVMDADGTSPRRITNEPENVNADNPTWSPDGQQVIFISNRPGGTGPVNAWLVGRSGGTPELLSGNSYYCAWQPIPEASSETKLISAPKPVKLGKIPASAEIVYYQGGLIYVMDRNGGNVAQITFSSRTWEHVAVSPDRQFIVGNEQLDDPNMPGVPRSRLWLYDLEKGTESQLVPNFYSAGSGGVDWDAASFIYFGARPRLIKGPLSPRLVVDNQYQGDEYKVRSDGTGLMRLTSTPDAGEGDTSVSRDSTMVAFVRIIFDSVTESDAKAHTELWVMNSDGSNQRLVYKGGETRTSGVFDPEFSDDNQRLAFSQVNASVPPNFPKHPAANTAHDIWTVKLDGSDKRRMTIPGPISIIPDWKGRQILYQEISERDNYNGMSMVNDDGTGQRTVKGGVQFARWIPGR